MDPPTGLRARGQPPSSGKGRIWRASAVWRSPEPIGALADGSVSAAEDGHQSLTLGRYRIRASKGVFRSGDSNSPTQRSGSRFTWRST